MNADLYKKYRDFKEKSASLPHVKVSKEQFVQMLIADGMTPDKAAQQAIFAEGLCSYIQIGEQMVGISNAQENAEGKRPDSP